jgi:hypothetical protein
VRKQHAALRVERARKAEAATLARMEAQTAEIHVQDGAGDALGGVHRVFGVVALLGEPGDVESPRLGQQGALVEGHRALPGRRKFRHP